MALNRKAIYMIRKVTKTFIKNESLKGILFFIKEGVFDVQRLRFTRIFSKSVSGKIQVLFINL